MDGGMRGNVLFQNNPHLLNITSCFTFRKALAYVPHGLLHVWSGQGFPATWHLRRVELSVE